MIRVINPTLVILVGIIFGLLASAMAYLITYEEYRKHLLDRKRCIRESLAVAGVTFVIFFGLSAVAGFLLYHEGRVWWK